MLEKRGHPVVYLIVFGSISLRCKPDCLSIICSLGYLRLGCMARDKGQIYEASDWFKEALQINQVL